MVIQENEESLLLDSKLITATLEKGPVQLSHINNSNYNIKIVECGEYLQVYFYEKNRLKKRKKDKSDLALTKIDLEEDNKQNDEYNDFKARKIEDRNIIRSKLECQRLAKANMTEWKTFITLTYAKCITDLKVANKEFHNFIRKVQRVKKDFKYIVVPEFQKRGAVHYHLLTNIDYDDRELLFEQEDKPEFIHIKYWLKGFTKVEKLRNDPKKVVGYISKYMTKDVDNRLFGHRRYFYSMNLEKPRESYINTEIPKELEFYTKKIQGRDLIYQNEYSNTYDDSKVTFLELLKK